MSNNTDLIFVNSIETYGKIKATISFGISIIIAIVMIIIAIIILSSKKSKLIEGTIIKKNYCTNTTCNFVVQYEQNGILYRKNINASIKYNLGDKISIDNQINKLFYGILFIAISIILLSCGYSVYKAIMSNKYFAIENALY